jgi:hypothetical protein
MALLRLARSRVRGPRPFTRTCAALSAAACGWWSAAMRGNKHFLAIEEGLRESTGSLKAFACKP